MYVNFILHRMTVVDMELSSMYSKTSMLSFFTKGLTTIKILPMAL